jgi:hypothetical protein
MVYRNHDLSMHHDIMYYVVLSYCMYPMIHMYFITKDRKIFKIILTRGCHVFGFMGVIG